MRMAAVGLVLAMLCGACANDFKVPMRDGGNVGDGSVIGDGGGWFDGGAASDGARPIDGGVVTLDGGSPGDGGPSCAELKDQYMRELTLAKMCVLNTTDDVCSITRKNAIDCGCETPVNKLQTQQVANLDEMLRRWAAMGCQTVGCPPVACLPIGMGSCFAGATGTSGMCRGVSE